ncbi:MAG: class I SAM-dependent methyltransferase [Dehalococcoidia bacterium]|nr:class I SAM-dependent methyltransferase [Dehalococcoidia bacterium]
MTQEVYDKIAKYYQLLFDDWDKAVATEARRLDGLFQPRGIRSVLDCTCGTGLQCIGLAKEGYVVTGCDTSRKMLRQARRNARSAAVKVRWATADVRFLQQTIHGPFDAVITCGNSLAHMKTSNDLNRTLSSMYDATKVGGWCLVGGADYDAIMQERPEGSYRRFAELDDHWVLIYDTRTYGKQTITATFTVVRETQRGWRERRFVMKLRAWRRSELLQGLLQAGFAEVLDLSVKGKIDLLARKPRG